MIEEFDALFITCTPLGEVPFHYCRTVNDDLPCRRVIACWQARFEITRFLNENYSFEEIYRALASPTKSRVETILDLIEKAKKAKEEEGICT